MKAMIKLSFVKEEYKNTPFEVVKKGENYVEVNIPNLGVARLYNGEYELIE